MDTSDIYYKMCYEAFPEDRDWGNVFKTQDQLQEMVDPDNFLGCYILLRNLQHFAQQEIINDIEKPSKINPQSMEQLWLAFVMKEKFNKVWDGKEWCNGR